MGKVVEYEVLVDRHPADLAAKVQEYIANGWELAGGVGVSTSPEWYAQALTKAVSGE